MPCWDENGLLPGRGAPGFGPDLAAGFGAAPGSGAPGVALAVGAAGAASAAGAAGAGVAAAGLAAGLVPGFAAEEAAGAAAGFEPGFGAPEVAGLAAAGLAAAALEPGKASRNLRATGGSTVEDAERTNSPISCNLVSASFEVIPSSLASS